MAAKRGTIAAYAKHRNVSRPAIYKAIKANRIPPPDADGMLDFGVCDASWKARTRPVMGHASTREPVPLVAAPASWVERLPAALRQDVEKQLLDARTPRGACAALVRAAWAALDPRDRFATATLRKLEEAIAGVWRVQAPSPEVGWLAGVAAAYLATVAGFVGIDVDGLPPHEAAIASAETHLREALAVQRDIDTSRGAAILGGGDPTSEAALGALVDAALDFLDEAKGGGAIPRIEVVQALSAAVELAAEAPPAPALEGLSAAAAAAVASLDSPAASWPVRAATELRTWVVLARGVTDVRYDEDAPEIWRKVG